MNKDAEYYSKKREEKQNKKKPDITSFNGKWRWLSNFWIVEVEFEGDIYPSTENAYQASKCLKIEDRKLWMQRSLGMCFEERLYEKCFVQHRQFPVQDGYALFWRTKMPSPVQRY